MRGIGSRESLLLMTLGEKMDFMLICFLCRPPLQEGHHVTSGLRDVVGGRDANQDLERDCMSDDPLRWFKNLKIWN